MLQRIRHSMEQVGQRAGGYTLTRFVFLRLLGVVYLAAFGSLWTQVLGLIGPNGIAPAADFLDFAASVLGPQRFWRLPTLAWIGADSRVLLGLCGVGTVASALVILGVLQLPALALLWVCYLSLVNVGQDFLSFQWDALLLETGFLAIFFAPANVLSRPPRERPPSIVVLWLLRWLLFRLMFFSGAVKLASGDPTWRGLTALTFHYETQPLPTPLAWYAHHLPRLLHVASAGGVFLIELVAPFLIFAPRRARFVGAALMAALQVLIMLTGNFAFFNLLTLALCVLLLDDAALHAILPARLRAYVPSPPEAPSPVFRRWLVVPLAVVVLLSSGTRAPGPLQHLVSTLEPFHIVNNYGLFAVMTTERPEIIVEGSADGQSWLPYEFRYKPTDPRRAPAWIAPYHPRLDWQMWFAALGRPESNEWFRGFLVRLLEGSPDVLGLLGTNPFPDAPPRFVRAQLYQYRFSDTWAGGEAGWWQRELEGVYIPPMSLGER